MTNKQKGIPWPVWAVVTIVAALIAGGYFKFRPANPKVEPEPGPPGIQPEQPEKPPVENNDIAGTYLMDNQTGRVIVISRKDGNRYRIEEASSPWPWAGEATLDGGQLTGHAEFRKSLATMRVEGVVRDDKSIVISYKFITGSDGMDAAGRVDEHVWYPRN